MRSTQNGQSSLNNNRALRGRKPFDRAMRPPSPTYSKHKRSTHRPQLSFMESRADRNAEELWQILLIVGGILSLTMVICSYI